MIEKLKWDSEFFGYNVGKLVIGEGELINEQALL